VLAVDGGQRGRQLAKDGHRDERAVDRRPALAGLVDLAAEDHLVAFGRQPVRGDRPRARRALEDRLHHRPVLARPDQLGRGSRPEQEAQRVDEDRLAGSRLAGEERQASIELHLQLGDDRYVVYFEQFEHQRGRAGRIAQRLAPVNNDAARRSRERPAPRSLPRDVACRISEVPAC
jgi:hypothetical protein